MLINEEKEDKTVDKPRQMFYAALTAVIVGGFILVRIVMGKTALSLESVVFLLAMAAIVSWAAVGIHRERTNKKK